VRIRRRKPCVLLRFRLFGWNVRLLIAAILPRSSRCVFWGRLLGASSGAAGRGGSAAGRGAILVRQHRASTAIVDKAVSRFVDSELRRESLWTCGTWRRLGRPTNGTRCRRHGSNRAPDALPDPAGSCRILMVRACARSSADGVLGGPS
jgi:hypothetical protein